MQKYSSALKVLFFFVLGNVVVGFLFRSILIQFSPAFLNPTVLMPMFGLQATLILVFLSGKYHLNFYLNHPGFRSIQIMRGFALSIAFAAPVLLTVIGYSGGEFRTELTLLSFENNKALFFIALAYSEELIFRGLLLGIFISIVSVRKAILLQAILFSLVHWPQDPDLSILAWRILVGYIFGYVAYKSNSLLPGFLVHTTWNFCLLIFSALSPGVFGFYGASVLGVFVISSQIPREAIILSSTVGCIVVAALTRMVCPPRSALLILYSRLT